MANKTAIINCYHNNNFSVRTANTPIDILPETLKEHYKTVKPQEDEVNLDDLQSRWWLSKQLVDNLNTKGWDVFVLASTINFQLY